MSAEFNRSDAAPISTKIVAGQVAGGSLRWRLRRRCQPSHVRVKIGTQRSISKMPCQRKSSAARASAKVRAMPAGAAHARSLGLRMKFKTFFVIEGIVH